MSTLVLYATHYGHSQQYAEWIAEDLRSAGREVILARVEGEGDVPTLAVPVSSLVFVGANYAGTVNGIEAFVEAAERWPHATRTVLTVAWTSPEQTKTIRKLHEKNIPAPLREDGRTLAFHARGAIDHTRLTLPHKAGMRALKTFISAKPEAKRTAEDHETLEYWGRAVSFVSRDAVGPVVHAAMR